MCRLGCFWWFILGYLFVLVYIPRVVMMVDMVTGLFCWNKIGVNS